MPWTRIVFVTSIIVGVVVWGVVALDWSFWAKILAYVVATAAHACVAGLIATTFYIGRYVRLGRLPRSQLRIAAVFGIEAVVLGYVLVRVAQAVLTLPIDGGWKALYFVLGASAFWIAGAATVLVLSPAFPLNAVGTVAANAAMSVLTVVAVAVVLALATAHLASNRQKDQDDDTIAIPTIETIDAGVYVALGDSYSAGEGLPPFLEGTATKDEEGRPACHRSDRAYPMVMEFENEMQLVFRACSGAISADIDLEPVKADHPAQVATEQRDEVTLVTLTVGGNDAAFSRIVQSCFFFEDCIGASFEPPEPSVDRRRVIFPGRAPLRVWAHDALALLEQNVKRVYGNVRSAYPNARVIVIGYPYLFPDRPAPLWQNDCAVVLRRVNRDERRQLRDLTDELNAMIEAKATAAGLEFVSPAEMWDGHEPCGDDGQYTNALKPFGSGGKPLDGGSFHPNTQGQRALARLVSCYLNENPEPPGDAADSTPSCAMADD